MSDPPTRRPTPVRPVQYKGADLEAEKGPGLGCFWSQLVAFGILVVLTPLSVNLGWPDWASALLLFATIAVLLVSGQTIIFLLRLVAAERREGRRRPLAASSRTVGELEDGSGAEVSAGTADAEVAAGTADGGATTAQGATQAGASTDEAGQPPPPLTGPVRDDPMGDGPVRQ